MFEVTSLSISNLYTHEYMENTSVCDIVIFVHEWEGEPHADDDSAALYWKPFEFLDSPEFASPYIGLIKKLQSLVRGSYTL